MIITLTWQWFWLCLAAAATWSLTFHIDKHLLSKYFDSGVGALSIYSGSIGLVAAGLIWLYQPSVLTIATGQDIGTMVVAGWIYLSGLLFYLWALQKNEAANVSALFLLNPVFGYFFGLVLGEMLSSLQILACAIILFGAAGQSFSQTESGWKFNSAGIGLMLVASGLTATNSFLFKFTAQDTPYLVTAFWQYLGFFMFAVTLFVAIPKYRRQFLATLRHSPLVIGLNGTNEVIGVTAQMLLYAATLAGPLAVSQVAVESLTPIMVFLGSLCLVVLLPKTNTKLFNSTPALIQYLSSLIIMIAGSVLLATG